MGKSRVVPKDAPSIPRLELTAATVATKISYLLYKELHIQDVEEFYWTDSKVVLCYITNERKRFHAFVANRVKIICDYTEKEQWRYVKSELNPADYASRGTTGKQFLEAKTWLKGPEFLWKSEESFPTEQVSTVLDMDDKEVRQTIIATTTMLKQENYILTSLENNISSWYRMKKVLAIIIRIAERKKFIREEPKVEDLLLAEEQIIKWIQFKEFESTIQILDNANHTAVTRESEKKHKLLLRQRCSLIQLDPFLDSHGILRVGGRLRRAKLSDTLKYPAIIPHDGKIPILIAKHCHDPVYHAGRGITTNELRNSG